MKKTDGHHLVLGEIADFLTGKTIQDTHDERYRQEIARILVEQKGFAKEEIRSRRDLRVTAGGNCAVIKVDFSVKIADRVCMIIRYAPGSLVTRHRPALAASRTLTGYQIPVVVVTNGRNAEILDGASGAVTARGLQAIPSKQELVNRIRSADFEEISEKRSERELRILYAFDVDDSCPCDTDICRLP